MKILSIIAVMFIIISCNNKVIKEDPIGYSIMPDYMDIDSLAPFNLDDTNRVVDSTYEDFKSIPVDGGWLKMSMLDSLELPPGVLISDRKAVLYVFYRESWKRQKDELRYCKYLMKEYYDKAIEAEKLYHKEIIRLERVAERSWLEKNMGYIGFAAGVATSVLLVSALFGGTDLID